MSLPPPDLPPPDETPEPETASPPPASSPGKEAPQPRTGSQRTPEQADGEGAGKTETDFGSTKSKLDSELIVAQITEAVVFPICGKGWPLMIPALVLAGLVTLVGWIPLVGWFLSIGVGIYFAAYFHRSLSVSMMDGSQPPDWPDMTKAMSDVLLPGARILLAMLVSMVPAIILGWMDGKARERGMTAGEVIGMAAFALYFPMAALSITARQGWAMALPQNVLPAIQKCLPEYVVVAGCVFLADYLQQFVRAFLGWIPFVGSTSATLVWFYLLLVNGRLMGRLYVKHRKAIGW